uniref:beta strand repeat-containing protein n=1 Tax=Pseudomonas sp. TaxID=306 RepID=UPI0028ACF2EA
TTGVSGLLTLGSLTGHAGWTLTGGDADIGSATLDGNVGMTLTGDLLGLDTLTGGGNWSLQAVNATVGDATLNRASATAPKGTVNMTLSQDLLALGLLDANADWTLHARNASVGEAVLSGNVEQTTSGTLGVHGLTAGGNWNLHGAVSSIDNADIDGVVVLTQTGLLTIGSLTGDHTLNLSGTDAVLGTAMLGGTVQATLSGDLQVTNRLTAQTTTLDIGSGSNIQALDVSGDLNLKVARGLDMGSATVTGKAVLTHDGLTGAVLDYGDLNIGTTLDVKDVLTAGAGLGDWKGGDATVGQTATFDVGSADLGSLVSQHGRLSLKAANLFAADTLTSAVQDVDLLSGSADLGDVLAATAINVLTTGNLSIFTGNAGNDITLHTVDGGALGDIRFGAYYADDASGFDLNRDYLKAGQNIDIFTDGNVYGGNAVAGSVDPLVEGEVRIVGRNLDFGRAQSLGSDVFLQATGSLATGEGNITGLMVDAKRDVSIIANGNLSMPTVKYGGTYSLKAGRDLTVGIGGNLDVTGAAEAGRDLTFLIGGKIDLASIKAGRDVLVTSGQYINITDGVTAGGNITLKAGNGDITVGTGIVSTGVPYLDQILHGNVLVEASGDVTTPLISAAAGAVDVQGHSLRVNNLAALNDIDLLARGLIQVSDTSQSGGHQTWHADDSIFFDRLLASGQALLDSLMDTNGTLLKADKGAKLSAGWRNGVAGDSDIRLAQAIAPTLSLYAGNLIRVADSGIGQSVDLHGQDIELYGRHTGSGQLDLLVDGTGQRFAQRFDTRLDAANIVSPHLYAVNSNIVSTGSRVDLQNNAYIDLLRLKTAQAMVVVDDLKPEYVHDADVQLYELDKAFSLNQQAVTSTTDAYVVHRKSTHQVLIPNFSEAHTPAVFGVMVQGVTAARYSEQHASGTVAMKNLADTLNLIRTVVPLPGDWTPPNFNNTPIDMRLNVDIGAVPQQVAKVDKWEL